MSKMNDICIDYAVHGHAQAKKTLAVMIKRSQERYYKKCVLGEASGLRDTLKCLLVGPSGTGKTHLVQTYSKIHNFPLICLDATQLMPTGNSDGINIKQLTKLIHDKAKELAKTTEFHSPEGVINQMFIFVDEFDKLGTSFDSSGNWNKHVQANFLTMIDNKAEFEGISWIFAGAFASLFEQKEKPAARGIGFFADESAATDNSIEILDEDIIKAGIIPELLGRISLIVQLDTFTATDYKTVLTQRLAPKYGLELTTEEIDTMVHKALKSGQGIRCLTRQLEKISVANEDLSVRPY